jgi:hypothetical protein
MVVITTTDASEIPSSVPVQEGNDDDDDDVDSVPSYAPISADVDAPVDGQQPSSPSLAPSMTFVSTAPIPPQPEPVVAPVPIAPVPPPSFNVESDLCELNEACAALNLTGQCCPTIDDQYLYCCNGRIEPTCQRNEKCAALGLEGACCPTAGNIPSNLDGIYLDCCTTVPDVCETEKLSKSVGPDALPDDNNNSTNTNTTTETTEPPTPSSCVRMAAVEYQEALSEFNNNSLAASSQSFGMTVGTVIVTVILVSLL